MNGLSAALLTHNANASNPANGEGAINPFRLDRSQAATADQSHDYTPEQMAFHAGLMDLFPEIGRQRQQHRLRAAHTPLNTTGLTMGYFDGNTVTAHVELCAAFRHERQFLRLDIRTVHARRH